MHPRTKDLTGKRFGKLVVLEITNKRIGGHIIWLCQCDCGNTIEVSRQELKTGDTKSCGCLRSQFMHSKMQGLTGSDHPCWINDRTKLKAEREYNPQYLIKQCFERDNYTCKCCGKGGGFNVHHLYNWTDYPEYRYDLNNLITLCVKCHRKFHKECGRRNLTPEIFYQWLERSKEFAPCNTIHPADSERAV